MTFEASRSAEVQKSAKMFSDGLDYSNFQKKTHHQAHFVQDHSNTFFYCYYSDDSEIVDVGQRRKGHCHLFLRGFPKNLYSIYRTRNPHNHNQVDISTQFLFSNGNRKISIFQRKGEDVMKMD